MPVCVFVCVSSSFGPSHYYIDICIICVLCVLITAQTFAFKRLFVDQIPKAERQVGGGS